MNFVLGFDGGNAKQIACYGYTIREQNGTLLAEGYGKCVDDKQTNNVAEWCGLYYGLLHLYGIVRVYDYVDMIYLHGDSQLVLRQLDGKYSVTKKHLRKYYDGSIAIVKKIEKLGGNVVTDWDYREFNTRPDELTHIAREL